MTTHITLTTFVVFFALAAFGAVTFALARFASHGGLSPSAREDEAPEDTAQDDATDEAAAPAQHPARGQGRSSSLDS